MIHLESICEFPKNTLLFNINDDTNKNIENIFRILYGIIRKTNPELNARTKFESKKFLSFNDLLYKTNTFLKRKDIFYEHGYIEKTRGNSCSFCNSPFQKEIGIYYSKENFEVPEYFESMVRKETLEKYKNSNLVLMPNQFTELNLDHFIEEIEKRNSFSISENLNYF